MADDMRDAARDLLRSTLPARALSAAASIGETAENLYGRVTRVSRRTAPAARTTDIELVPERGKRKTARSGARSARR